MKLLIQNGLLIDGTGAPGKHMDVRIRDRYIAEIGPGLSAEEGEASIDATNQVVCPGFVDIHRHHDARILYDPAFGACELRQGITTAVSGNCGISLTPCSADPARAREYYDFQEAVMGPVPDSAPKGYGEYLNLLSGPLPLNTAAMIGTGAVRTLIKGFDPSPFTSRELETGRALIEDALLSGAPGISLGIMYLPECYTTIEEYAALLAPAGKLHRPITVHIRGEGDSLISSIREAIEIARRAECPLEISHFKSCGMQNWRRDIYLAIEEIEKARASGQDVTVDFYPYDGGSTALTTMLPPAFVRGSMEDALARLGTPEGVREFCAASTKLYPDWDNYAVTLGWDRILISGTASPELRPFLGRYVSEAASEFGFESPAALAAHIMHADHGRTAIINMSMDQSDIDTIAKLPYSSIISDSIYAETDTPHPRMFGSFPKIIREYVMERQVLSLETAIQKMTLLPAQRMGLAGRGCIAPGNCADLLIFDPHAFRDRATYSAPAQYPQGLTLCLLNGEIAVRDDIYRPINTGTLLRAGTSQP